MQRFSERHFFPTNLFFKETQLQNIVKSILCLRHWLFGEPVRPQLPLDFANPLRKRCRRETADPIMLIVESNPVISGRPFPLSVLFRLDAVSYGNFLGVTT